MDVKIGSRWSGVIGTAIESGRFVSAEEVVAEALRLFALNERRFRELKESIEEALAEGGSYTSEDVMRHVEQRLAEIAKLGGGAGFIDEEDD